MRCPQSRRFNGRRERSRTTKAGVAFNSGARNHTTGRNLGAGVTAAWGATPPGNQVAGRHRKITAFG